MLSKIGFGRESPLRDLKYILRLQWATLPFLKTLGKTACMPSNEVVSANLKTHFGKNKILAPPGT